MFYTLIKQWVFDQSERTLSPIDIIIKFNSNSPSRDLLHDYCYLNVFLKLISSVYSSKGHASSHYT